MNDSNDEKYSKEAEERARSFQREASAYLLKGEVGEKLTRVIIGDHIKLENHFIAGTCSDMAKILKYVTTHRGEYKHGDDIRSYFEDLKTQGVTGIEFSLVFASVSALPGNPRYNLAASATHTFSFDIPNGSPHSGGGGTGYFHQNDCEWVPAP